MCTRLFDRRTQEEHRKSGRQRWREKRKWTGISIGGGAHGEAPTSRRLEFEAEAEASVYAAKEEERLSSRRGE